MVIEIKDLIEENASLRKQIETLKQELENKVSAEFEDCDDDAYAHQCILDVLHDTYVAKNHDYGNSFSKTFEEYGITSALVRIEDKINRLRSLAGGNTQLVNGESVKDTLYDLANYAILTIMELDKQDNDIPEFEGYLF